MSLITLTSRQNENNPNSNDPAILRNHFKDGIQLRKGDQIGLVSLTFNKLPMLEVVQGQNDTFTWRIGDRQNYLLHKVVVPAGTYTGETLATEIQTQLNDSTILGNYKGQWTCVFDSQLFQGNGGISIQYGQNEVPAKGSNTSQIQVGTLPSPTLNDGQTSSTIHGNAGSNNLSLQTNPDIVVQRKGVFPNDGTFEMEIKPIEGISRANFEAAFDVGGGGTLFNHNDGGVDRQFSVQAATGTAAANGWMYEAQFDNGDPPEFWYFIGQTQEGAVGVGTDENDDATQGGSYDVIMFYNNGNNTFRDATAGGRTADNGAGVGEVWTKFVAPPASNRIVIPLTGVGYGKSTAGLVRNQLFNGLNEYPADPNAHINNTFPSGYDYMFQVKDNAAFDQIQVSLGQLIKRAGISFPNAGWRDDSRAVFTDVSPNNWNTTLSGTAPANWTNFVYGTSNIKLTIIIRKVRTIEFKISHDGAGAGVFEEEVKLSKTGDNPTGAQQQTSNVKEWFYPYRPVANVNKGGRYSQSRYITEGIFDTTEIVSPLTSGNTALYLGREQEEDGAAHLEDAELAVGTTAPSNAQTLSAYVIFGTIIQDDIVPNGQIPANDVPTNRSENNISNLIGFPRFQINAGGQASNTYQSIQSVDQIVREPNLMVELTDFNIEGHNGDTSDKAKVIGIIPAEELNTNTRSGQLNYYSHFPIMIDLNIEHDMTTYDLNAVLRTPDGKIAEDLVNPTSITLMKKESEESRQKRLMENMKDDIISSIANRQEIKIDGIGRDFPRI